MPAFRLAHISDLHLPPAASATRAPFAVKRQLSRLAWRRKRRRHSFEALSALVEDLKAQACDHIAVTGDLTNFATADEFAAARDWLERLGAPESVTVSPGNHDALVGSAVADPFAMWRPWLGDDHRSGFPFVRRRGEIGLVNLCTAVPTAVHLAQGALGEAQREELAGILAALREEGLCRVVLMHHPPTPGVVSRRKALRDQRELLGVFAAHGAELVLHGHAHTAAVASVAGPGGHIPVLGVPSASAAGGHGPAARWHGLEIERAGQAWDVRVIARGFGRGGGGIEELGRYRLAQG